jgi:hypothetical protein
VAQACTGIPVFRSIGQKPFLLISTATLSHPLNLGIARGFNYTWIEQQTPSFVMGESQNDDERIVIIRQRPYR